ncbi:MAG: PilZ domain-containing protein [Oscillospiraceae bacterium]|nr:PilZ domain-containing protein [Oscillospiraceae bacterium]
MSVLGNVYTDCTVFIYDAHGNHLVDTSIRNHDRQTQQIEVRIMPAELKVNDTCKLLILSSPSPCEYHGKVKKEGGKQYIAMFQGQEKESRASARYPVNTPALIDALIVDEETHSLQSPIKVALINISTTGVRFRAPFYTFEDEDEFRMHLIISNNQKEIIAKVINHVDTKQTHSDYGCSFLVIK